MEIREMIKKGEGERIEFKEMVSDEIGRTVSAFSNTEGGIILLGVADDGRIVGVSEKTEHRIANIAQSLRPPVYPRIRNIRIERKEILVIEVERAESISAYKGIAYKRVGSHDMPLSPQELIQLAKDRGRIRLDEEVCREANLEDLDEGKITHFLDTREKARNIAKPKEMSPKTFLVNIKAAKEVGGEILPTNAGILFFGNNPQRFILQSQLRLARFKGDTMMHFLDRLEARGTLWEMLNQAEDFIRKNVSLFGFRTEASFRRIDKLQYPLSAIREALINAMIHRDYLNPADTRVAIFDDSLDIINPGRFPEGTTPQRPKHIPVNPLLCQFMFEMGFIEKYGTGIEMIKTVCDEWGILRPEYILDEIETKIVFRSVPEGVILKEIEGKLTLNSLQKRALEFLKSSGVITNKEYQTMNNVSRATATRDLMELVGAGLLKQKGVGRGSHFVLNI